MIRSLRVRHRRVILALALILPLLYVAALLARRPTPSVERERPAVSGFGIVQLTRDADGRPSLHLVPNDPESLPELLVYWGEADGFRPGEGTLLGTLPGPYPLPDRAVSDAGELLVYDPLHDEELLRVPLDGLGEE